MKKRLQKRSIILLLGMLVGLAACKTVDIEKSDSQVPEFVFTYAENQPEDYPTTLGSRVQLNSFSLVVLILPEYLCLLYLLLYLR